MTTLSYRVPSSTTNLAHGFDCFGAALACYNTITISTHDGDVVTAPSAPGTGLAELAESCRQACHTTWDCAIPAFEVSVNGDVPLARGMGSSATILIGVAAACRELAGLPADNEALARVTAIVEGHPDNVAAAALGGFTLAATQGDTLHIRSFTVPDHWRAVVSIPNYEVKTAEARKILPDQCSKEELITAVQSTALIVHAISQQNIDLLRGAFDNGWHEQYRGKLVAELSAIREATATDAVGTFLSGSGSTILTLCSADNAETVAGRIHNLQLNTIPNQDVRILSFDAQGCVKI